MNPMKRNKFSDSKANPTCKYCGTKSVFWKDTEYGWRLKNNDRTYHKCWKDLDEEEEG